MITRLARVTIYVRDQDEALRFYTETLGLEKRADVQFGPGARWLTVAPAEQRDVEILLQSGVPAMHGVEFARKIGERVGQGTTWVFATDDCRGDYETLKARGVTFTSEPQDQPYGVEAVFQDLYGNSFSLLQMAENPEAPTYE
jgi:predicted enzyme related to lactoylglutathione lyase